MIQTCNYETLKQSHWTLLPKNKALLFEKKKIDENLWVEIRKNNSFFHYLPGYFHLFLIKNVKRIGQFNYISTELFEINILFSKYQNDRKLTKDQKDAHFFLLMFRLCGFLQNRMYFSTYDLYSSIKTYIRLKNQPDEEALLRSRGVFEEKQYPFIFNEKSFTSRSLSKIGFSPLFRKGYDDFYMGIALEGMFSFLEFQPYFLRSAIYSLLIAETNLRLFCTKLDVLQEWFLHLKVFKLSQDVFNEEFVIYCEHTLKLSMHSLCFSMCKYMTHEDFLKQLENDFLGLELPKI